MATKRCAYKGCGSYTSPTIPSTDTFYAFPKDANRAKLWVELGGCREEIPFNKRYYCSKHFDESKYVASNPRRKQLLSTAIPWPCQKSSVKTNNLEYHCVESTMVDDEVDDDDEADDMQSFNEESVEITDEMNTIPDTIEEALHSYEYEDQGENGFSISLPPEKKKRKLVERQIKQLTETTVELHAGPSERSVTSNRATSSTLVSIEDETAKEISLFEEIDESKIMESPSITTFIFKGEEYIQMPKDDYVSEKILLLQKIRSYEEVFRNVKHLMDGVKI